MGDAAWKGIVDRRGRRLLLVSASVVLAIIAGWMVFLSLRGWSVAQLERHIRGEVPLGCDRRTVEAWFDRHEIAADGWSEKTTGSMRGHQTMPQLAGLRSEDLGGMLSGGLGGWDANVNPILPNFIAIYFFFDKQGRMVGHLVDATVDGL